MPRDRKKRVAVVRRRRRWWFFVVLFYFSPPRWQRATTTEQSAKQKARRKLLTCWLSRLDLVGRPLSRHCVDRERKGNKHRPCEASQPVSKHPTGFTQSTAQNKPESLSLNLSPRAIACIIWTNGKISHIKSSKKRRITTASFRNGNPETVDTL